jgi:hypothetical protein
MDKEKEKAEMNPMMQQNHFLPPYAVTHTA